MLEKLDGNGRTARGARDASITSKRKLREKEWMLKLRTVFSYGLNGWLGDDFSKEDTHVLVRSKFLHYLENLLEFLRVIFIN